MTVGVDLSFIRPDHTNGGTESCIKNLIRGWIINGKIKEFIFFVHEDIHKDYKMLFPECRFICYRMGGSHKVRTTWFQTFILPRLVKKYKIDVLYYPTYTSGYYRILGVPVVVNPHDIQYKFYPEYFSFLKRWYLNLGYSHSLKKADRIIAISNYVKDSLLEFYGDQCGDKIQTVYDPVDFDRNQSIQPKGISQPYILSVSSIQKHKNMITLVRAFERIHAKIPHQLVIVGCKGNGMEKIQEYLKEKNISDRILFTDYIKSEELDWLYENCSLYVTTSLYEGFGMTPIEAMGRGKPTISSKSTSLPEVTRNKAFYYEPAEDDRVLSELMLEVIEKGFNLNNAKELIDCYDKSIISAQLYKVFEDLL
ncbi:glycosyltransferase family 4 protein [Lacrimispora amygdalina]|uniref:glycosyltransferase family 4 protein n=1 Tax=Lacrimispora amygdalina TaxID=253257 RepID=UPI000BE35D8C|nr:glycosyltransferase family 1 protein [Lacrimispora amygdalina]